MSKSKAGAGHVAGRVTFLVGVARDDHSLVAARFAALRARNSGGKVALIHVMSPPEFQHWAKVESLMRQEARDEAQELLESAAKEVVKLQGERPSLHLSEGSIGEEILAHIDENPSINLLVVGAAPPDEGHGSLISWLAGQLAGRLHVPLVIVPGNLTEKQLRELT